MKVVVTGGAGYLGSALTQILLRNGNQVTVLDRLLHGGHGLVPLYMEDGFTFIRGDIRSKEVVDTALEGADAVVHLAAIVGDPACASDPELANETNVDGAMQVFTSVREKEIGRFIFASTCSNYGRMYDPDTLIDEESKLNPISLYAETKVQFERTLLDLQTSDNTAATVLRFATLFGLSPRPRLDLTVNDFTAQLFSERRLEVYGEQFWRPYVHVRDAARAIAIVLDAPKGQVSGQVYNVGDTEQNYTKGQLVELMSEKLGDGLDIAYIRREEDPRDYRVSFEKIKRDLGYKITRTVSDGIDEIMDAIGSGVITELGSEIYRND